MNIDSIIGLLIGLFAGVCPDRCWRTETTFCVGVIEENDGKGISQTNNQD